MTTLVGCSGYHYDDWRGRFYPADLAKADFLRYYSLFFPVVELDYAWSQPPQYWQLEALAALVPRSFRFVVKAPRRLSQDKPQDWQRLAGDFIRALRARGFSERLAAVILQLPRRFRYTNPNRLYLGELTDEFAGLPLFLEIQAEGWLGDSTIASAKHRRIGLVMVDDQALTARFGRKLPTIADRALLRLRGWSAGHRSSFGAYSDYELSQWQAAVIKAEDELKAKLSSPAAAGDCIVLFNNYREANAVRDARRFQALLDASRDKLPGLATL